MIEKTIGVIPPRNELNSFSDIKTENLPEKSEFEGFLTKLDRKDPDRPALGGPKKKVQDPEIKESRPEKNMARDSEKTKRTDEDEEETINEPGDEKKVKTKPENTEMVLMNMASPESVIKVPDTEENLDNLTETTQVANVADATEAVQAQPAEVSVAPVMAPEIPVMEMPPIAVESAPEFVSEPVQVEVELPPSVQAEESAPIEQTAPAVDNKVLETLNREKLFQKLDAMTQKAPDVAVETAPAAPVLKDNIVKNVKSEHVVTSEKANAFAVSAPEMNAKSEKKTDQDDQSQMSSQDANAAPLAAPTHHAKDFARVAAEVQVADVPKAMAEPNVKEILNQAQYLVTQGGGEVSVKMTPEGMGEVHLKVMLDNGKMSVEMNTLDKSVQKMIQDNLSDLKSSLAAHQISVEHVTLNNKMSSVEALQKSSDMQNSHDARNFSEGFSQNPQQSKERDQRQQAARVFNYETERAVAVPIAKAGINKAVAQRAYSLNAVA